MRRWRRASPALPQQSGPGEERAEQQPRVHAGDAPVVAPHPEVRQVAGRIGDPHRMIDDRRAGPVQAHDDLGVEIHALADAGALVDQRGDGGQRIDAQAAHRIADAERQGLDPNADMRDPAPHDPSQRGRAVVDRPACHDRVRTVLRQSEHVGDRRHVVLAVGVDLEAVAETRRAGKPEACENGGALASIDVEPRHPHALLRAHRAPRAPCVPAARCRHRSRRRPIPGHAAVRRWPASLASGCGWGSRRRHECLLPSCAAACDRPRCVDRIQVPVFELHTSAGEAAQHQRHIGLRLQHAAELGLDLRGAVRQQVRDAGRKSARPNR